MAPRNNTRLRSTQNDVEQTYHPSKGTLRSARQQKQIMRRTREQLDSGGQPLLERIQLLERHAFASMIASRLRYDDE